MLRSKTKILLNGLFCHLYSIFGRYYISYQRKKHIMVQNKLLFFIGLYSSLAAIFNMMFLFFNIKTMLWSSALSIFFLQAIFLICSLAMILNKHWGWLIVTFIYMLQIPFFKNGSLLLRLNMTPLHINFWMYKFGIDLISLALFIMLITQRNKLSY